MAAGQTRAGGPDLGEQAGYGPPARAEWAPRGGSWKGFTARAPCRPTAPGGQQQRPPLVAQAEKLKPSQLPLPSSSSPPPTASISAPARPPPSFARHHPSSLPPPPSPSAAPSPPASCRSSLLTSPQLSAAASLPSRPASPPESERGRLGGRADSVFPTAPHALSPSPSPSADAPPNLRLPRLSQQPAYPSLVSTAARQSQPPVAEALTYPPQARRPAPQPGQHFPSPFRSHAAASSPRRLLSARLWNPTNSTPRDIRPRKRRDSTPPAPSVPLQHPSLDNSPDAGLNPAAGDYPLLTLSEQRQSKHSPTTRHSFQLEQRVSHDGRVSLPRSVRASYDGNLSRAPTPVQQDFQEKPVRSWALDDMAANLESRGKERAAVTAPDGEDPGQSFTMDLERGPDASDPRPSNVSGGDGIGSALSSSNSSIMGEDVQPDAGEEWGPQHPCYPHLNPHVPVDSFEYAATRIIRIRRDWLLQGDLAPTFSNLYPEILDPAGVSEQEFRRIIEKLNGELVPTFDPYSLRNIVDNLLGLATGWLWDDLGLTAIKSRLNALEKWIEKWNQEMEKTMASEEGVITPKIIPLRQTAYMMLDIQIPDPEIAPAPSSAGADASRTALPVEPATVMMA